MVEAYPVRGGNGAGLGEHLIIAFYHQMCRVLKGKVHDNYYLPARVAKPPT